MAITLKKTLLEWLPALAVLILLLVALYLLNLVTINPDLEEQYSGWMMYISGAALVLLTVAIIANLLQAMYQWYTHQAGSRFTLRLLSGFMVLTLFPLVVVSFFSMNFIGKRIDSWFDVRIERALEDSGELNRISLDTRGRQHLYALRQLADQLLNEHHISLSDLVDDWRAKAGAYEVVLFDAQGNFAASSVADVETLIPHFPVDDLQRELSVRDEYYHLEPVGEHNVFLRVALNVQYGDKDNSQDGLLTALFPISNYENLLAKSVESAVREYKDISFQRDSLKQAFRLVLLAIMVLTTLFSFWAAFIFSRRLTRPVRVLVEGTLAVAAGDLEKKLPVSDRDDFSLLARSFNTMTKRLSDAQWEREQAGHQLQREHDYLFVVLEHLTSGVITLDAEMAIKRVNSAASQILGAHLQNYHEQPLQSLGGVLPSLEPFLQAVTPHLVQGKKDWQVEVTLELVKKRKIIACRGSALPDVSAEQQGYVLVFDDVSDLIQAEHDAAWGEVARRLAHEIKNPLTPIQLSAERLAHKLKPELKPESAQFLQRMTNTIVQQVDALKSMVNAFSDYAKTPALVLQMTDLNRLVNDVVELYRTNEQQVTIKTDLQLNVFVRIDGNRMRQLLINLLKNALEALGEAGQAGEITLLTQLNVDFHQPIACLVVKDNGSGIPVNLLPRLFEPYVTTKHKGTGLGLAIVKKIVEEHGGSISAQNNADKGAMITVQLPVSINKG